MPRQEKRSNKAGNPRQRKGRTGHHRGCITIEHLDFGGALVDHDSRVWDQRVSGLAREPDILGVGLGFTPEFNYCFIAVSVPRTHWDTRNPTRDP